MLRIAITCFMVALPSTVLNLLELGLKQASSRLLTCTTEIRYNA